MKKYFIITVTVLSTIIIILASLYNEKAKRYNKLQTMCGAYMRYYNSSEELYDLLEEEEVLEPYLEPSSDSKYLEALNDIRKKTFLMQKARPAKLIKQQ